MGGPREVLVALASCDRRSDFSRPCGAGSRTWRRSGNNSGRFDAAAPMRAPAEGQRGPGAYLHSISRTIRYLPSDGLRPHAPCKKQEKAVVSVMLFWGVGFATLGWLVFKIAERM
jgi:hypothetical protein